MLKVPNVSELTLLDTLTNAWGNTLSIRLFVNDITPDDATVLADLTEAFFAGYASQQITNWLGASTVDGKAKATADENVFAHDGGAQANDVYGYYVTDSGGNLLWLERDPNGPVNMSAAAHRYRITPTITLKSEG